MTHLGTRRIETNRLYLRPFDVADADMMFKNWANDIEVAKFLTWLPHGEIKNTEWLLNLWVSQYNNLDRYNWGIVLKSAGELIGGIDVVDVNVNAKRATIGYCIGKEWWGQGIMTEGFGAVIPYLFEDIGFNSICACHDVRNIASGKVMLKCGLTYEGTLRQSATSNMGEIIDMAHYSILKNEYFSK